MAGRHADNLAPSLLGGAVLVRSLDPPDVVTLPTPAGLTVVLAHPDQRMRTADARAALPATVPRDVAMHQMAQVAAMVAALYSGDLALLGRALDDRIAEPARAPLLPGFLAAKRAALEAGALGASISGSGPTAFALAKGQAAAERIGGAMAAAYAAAGIACVVRIDVVDTRGARVVSESGSVRMSDLRRTLAALRRLRPRARRARPRDTRCTDVRRTARDRARAARDSSGERSCGSASLP